MAKTQKFDVVIVGGGIAGITTALEILNHSDLKVCLIDRDSADRFGGLAKESFGGIFFVDSPLQRKRKIEDSVEQAKQDWYSFAEFSPEDVIPKQWADYFIENCTEKVYHWLKEQKISFFPFVHWVERGLYTPGNSVPRFHMVWGTGHELAVTLVSKLMQHTKSHNLEVHFNTKVEELIFTDQQATGVRCKSEQNEEFEFYADHIVIATGGISGNIPYVKKNWFKAWGPAPDTILNGSHRYALGDMHWQTEKNGGRLTNMDKLWTYAAGVHHPRADKPDHGLSIVPPKSALWLNYRGERIGPMPLVSGYDTRFLVEEICRQKKKYSWQIMNYSIALKELAVSGSQYNDAIRDKKILGFLARLLFGDKKLVNHLISDCIDVATGNTIEELHQNMNALEGSGDVDLNALRNSINSYDRNIARGKSYFNDEQLRRIMHLRNYRGDKMRTSNFKAINDRKSLPLIAIREYVLSRKSLGGIQTDLQSKVLSGEGKAIAGLYAVGEAAGYGGGGIHGLRSLEGTFLGTCIFTGRIAAQSITNSN